MSLDRIWDKVRQWGRPWTSGSEPLEIHRAILEDVEAQAVAAGGGRRVFPFDRVEVKLLAATPEERVRLEAVAHEAWDLPAEVAARLRGAGIRVPEGLVVSTEVVESAAPAPGGRRYALSFARTMAAAAPVAGRQSRETDAVPIALRADLREEADGDLSGAPTVRLPVAPPAGASPAGTVPTGAPAGTASAAGGMAAARSGRPVLRLAVLKGSAAQPAYSFDAERIYLGRLAEVLDGAGRVRRRNDVAFLEEGEVNQTVSREHARIAWDAESRSFWLRDEASASGTVIFRAGRSIEVSRHDRRGVRLESGDEVYLGRAAVRVEVAAPG